MDEEAARHMTGAAGAAILGGDGRPANRERMVQAAIDGARPAGDTDADLVRRAQRGDAEAFDALVRPRLDPAYRLAVAILRSEVDAQDAVQDAFLAAWRHLRQLHDPGRLDAWLQRIVVNQCRMSLRHRHVVRVREIAELHPTSDRVLSGEPTQPGADDGLADADHVRMAFAHLDADQRVILVLHHVEDRPVAEIAATLRVPVGTVKWRLHAARQALERALGEVAR